MCLNVIRSYVGSDHVYKVFGQMEQEKQAKETKKSIYFRTTEPLSKLFLQPPVEVRKQIYSHYLAAAGKLERGLWFEP